MSVYRMVKYTPFPIPRQDIMFDTHLFTSWISILGGACLFALLFITLGIMSDYAFDGIVYVSNQSLGLSALAFTGYIWVALYLKTTGKSD